MHECLTVIKLWWFNDWNHWYEHAKNVNMFQTFEAVTWWCTVLQVLSFHSDFMRGIIKGMKRSWMDAFKDLKNKKTYAYVLLSNVNKDCFNAKISCSFHAWTLEHETFEYMRVLWGEPQKSMLWPMSAVL